MKPVRVVLLALALALLVPGCKTAKTKVCDHLEELLAASGGETSLDRLACEEQVKNYERTCTNFDVVVDCWLAAPSRSQFGRCGAQCQEQGGSAGE
jgi:hypothetical protein